MAEAELIEQLRAQVMSLKSPRSATQGRGTETTNSSNSGDSSRGRLVPAPSLKYQSRRQASIVKDKKQEGEVMGDALPVLLDVGGTKFRTSVGTLRSIENSYFALMMNGLFEPTRTEEGHIFIDRNGKLFGHILDYMRGYIQNERSELPEDLATLRSLKRESEYFRLPALTLRITQTIQRIEDSAVKLEEDIEGGSSVIIQDDEIDQEIDIIYSAVTHNTPHFPEEKLTDLISRINFCMARRAAEGFKQKHINSGVVSDPTKPLLFTMYMQVILMRNRKIQNANSPVISERSRQPTNSINSYQTHFRASPVNLQELQEQFAGDIEYPLPPTAQSQRASNYDRQRPVKYNISHMSYPDHHHHYHTYASNSDSYGKRTSPPSPPIQQNHQNYGNRDFLSHEFKPDNYRINGRMNYRSCCAEGAEGGYEGYNQYGENNSIGMSPQGTTSNNYNMPLYARKISNPRVYSNGSERQNQAMPQLQLAIVNGNQSSDFIEDQQIPQSAMGGRHDGWVNQSPHNWHD